MELTLNLWDLILSLVGSVRIELIYTTSSWCSRELLGRKKKTLTSGVRRVVGFVVV